MKRRTVLTFRVPHERRIKALFGDATNHGVQFDDAGKKLGAALESMYRESPDRALEVIGAIFTIVTGELEQMRTSRRGGR